MASSRLFAVTALFATPDQIVNAARETARAGYSRWDVNTPYPVHGMDGAMGLRPSRLGFFALAFGILGAAGSALFITWVTLFDYPLVIGGKPFWSWPAFVPVIFEVTVLLASVLSVVTMLVLYFKFPNISHPLHNTAYMKRVSSDAFGLCILADDPHFDESHVREFLRSLGGQEIGAVFFDAGHGFRPRLFEPRFMAVLALTAVVVAGGTYFVFNILMFMNPFDWMSEQPKLKAQEQSGLFRNGIGMRTPVPGTVARGFLPYTFAGQPDSAARYLLNPLPLTDTVLEQGKKKYLTFCSPCHGDFGRGDSRLHGQFPNPPTLHTDKARTWRDGRYYHVITEGQNVMPGYASQISRDDRWAIIHYVRALQRAHDPKEADLR